MEPRSSSWQQVGKWAMATGLAWTVQSAMSLAFPNPTDVLDYTMVVPMTLTMIVLWQLRGVGAFGGGRIAQVIAGLVSIGALTVIPCQIGFANERDALIPFEIVATAALILGLIIGGIGIIRARVLPRWTGIALIVAQPLTMALGLAFSPISPLADHGDYTGALGHGLVWLAIGLTLLGKRLPFLDAARTGEPAAA
jgi:hypothetical protein